MSLPAVESWEPDIATRITVLQLGKASDPKGMEMVDKGEAALNVDLLSKVEIVRATAGSLNVAQILCQHAVLQAGIRETTQTVTTVETDMRRITTVAVDRIEAKFDKTVEAFAAIDGFDSRTCIELLASWRTPRTASSPCRSCGLGAATSGRASIGCSSRTSSCKRLASASICSTTRLESAGVAVLLVSVDFLASPFINDNELPPLFEAAEADGCQILIVPVRASLLGPTDTPELSRYQAVLPPDRPLNAMSEPEREEDWVNVARSISNAVRVEQ